MKPLRVTPVEDEDYSYSTLQLYEMLMEGYIKDSLMRKDIRVPKRGKRKVLKISIYEKSGDKAYDCMVRLNSLCKLNFNTKEFDEPDYDVSLYPRIKKESAELDIYKITCTGKVKEIHKQEKPKGKKKRR